MRTSLFQTSTRLSASRITSTRSWPLSLRKAADRRLFQPGCQWCVPPRHSPAPLCLMCSLNATAATAFAGPNIMEDAASVSVTGRPIPQVDIGLSAFEGIASSTIFLTLDTSMDLSVSAKSAPSGGAQACVDASTELAVNIGAEAPLLDLSDASSTGETVFEKTFRSCRSVTRNASRGFLSHPVASRFMAASNASGCLTLLPSSPGCLSYAGTTMLAMLTRPSRACPSLGARVSDIPWHSLRN
jgi:hypothetical protein